LLVVYMFNSSGLGVKRWEVKVRKWDMKGLLFFNIQLNFILKIFLFVCWFHLLSP
jgi:hypothetical protein